MYLSHIYSGFLDNLKISNFYAIIFEKPKFWILGVKIEKYEEKNEIAIL